MKKSLILVGMLAIGYAYAQEGKVGINTDQPNATLDVKANTNNGSKVLELQNSAGTKLVTALDNGNVGIGTISPQGRLEVKEESWWPLVVNSTNTGGGGIALIPNDMDKRIELSVTGEGNFRIWANGNKLNLDRATGNIGIDTNSPTQKLDIEGNARVRQMTDATSLESTYTKAVVADANGNLAVVSRTTPTIPNGTQTIFGNRELVDIMKGDTFLSIARSNQTRAGNYFRYAGQSITLPPGKWIVYCGFLAHYNLDKTSYNIVL